MFNLKTNTMIKTKIGENAGLIWNYLDEKSDSSLTVMKKELKLKDADLNLALGWLARENKISFYEKEDILFVYLIY